MTLRINMRRWLIMVLAVASAVGMSRSLFGAGVVEGFAWGWMAFGLTLLACRANKPTE
jgi:hypothetical protein